MLCRVVFRALWSASVLCIERSVECLTSWSTSVPWIDTGRAGGSLRGGGPVFSKAWHIVGVAPNFRTVLQLFENLIQFGWEFQPARGISLGHSSTCSYEIRPNVLIFEPDLKSELGLANFRNKRSWRQHAGLFHPLQPDNAVNPHHHQAKHLTVSPSQWKGNNQ